MKKFEVPVNTGNDDYIETENLWLTFNNIPAGPAGFSVVKLNNKNELLFGIGRGADKFSEKENISSNNLDSIYKKLNTECPGIALFYINTRLEIIQAANVSNLSSFLINKSSGKILEITGNGKKINYQEGDEFIIFSSKLDQKILDKIIRMLDSNKNISYSLIYEIETLLKDFSVEARVIALVDFSSHYTGSFSIKSSLLTVGNAIEKIRNHVQKFNMDKIWQIETVLHEALVNAITYGNELDYNNDVRIRYEVGDNGLRIFIHDAGAGFDITNISVPIGTEAIDWISGRGIYIMAKFTDAIFYNETGNQVILYFSL